MIYGYVRVSTKKQDTERQKRNILGQYEDAQLFEDYMTGTKIDRPAWGRLMKTVKSGDTIVFDEVSRMSRNADEGVAAYHDLFARGIELVFIKEPHINTSVYRQEMNKQLPNVKTGDEAGDRLFSSILAALNRYTLDLAERQIRMAFEKAQSERDTLSQRTIEGQETARRAGKHIGATKGDKHKTQRGETIKLGIKKYNRIFGGKLNDTETCQMLGCSTATFYKYRKELLEEAGKA